MQQYLYLGELEEEFYRNFTQMVQYKIDALEPQKLEVISEPPYGVIIVAKDYESCWILDYKYYLGWKVVFAPVAVQFVKGYKEQAMQRKQQDKQEDVWYCTECGTKHTKGKYCGNCGTKRVEKQNTKPLPIKAESKPKVVYAERASVCMGDDCHAPHRCPLEYEENTLLSQFMSTVAAYVPEMDNFTWEVRCNLQTLAYLIFDDKGSWTYELAVEDAKLDTVLDKYLDKELYEEKEIFCSKY